MPTINIDIAKYVRSALDSEKSMSILFGKLTSLDWNFIEKNVKQSEGNESVALNSSKSDPKPMDQIKDGQNIPEALSNNKATKKSLAKLLKKIESAARKAKQTMI